MIFPVYYIRLSFFKKYVNSDNENILIRNAANSWDLKDEMPDFRYYYISFWAYPEMTVDTINDGHK